MAEAVKRVLLVDDNEDSRGFLAYALTSAGYVVDEAENGKQALDLLVSEGQVEPVVIILDLEMPVMSGWEFLAIARRYVRLARIPVVIVSGSQRPDEALRHEAIAGYLTKPINPDDVLRVIDHVAAGGTSA
jgi:chemotaxis family two-component system sensor histidine kinase/response regulator PixL